MSDPKLLYGLIVFFIVSGLVVGLIQEFVEGESEEFNTKSIVKGSREEISLKNSSTIFRVLLEIVKMSFWTFGSIPVLFELVFYVPLRLIFWFLVVRQITGSGG